MDVDQPGYWSPRMPLLAERREEMPDVDKLQRSFIRYGASSLPATQSARWQKTLSVSAGQSSRYGVAGTTSNGSNEGVAQLPDSISMQVTRAPAEFAVPVKQDRRMKPPFQVRVSASYSSNMSCSVTVTAHAICHSEYERIDGWIPPEIDAQRNFEMVDRSNPTELKGNRALEWRFEGQGTGGYGDLSGSGTTDAADLFNAFMTPAGRGEINLGSQHLPGFNFNDDPTSSRLHELLGGQSSLDDVYGTRGGGMGSAGAQNGLANGASAAANQKVVSHDFEFPNLEFAKPSRMNKVYMVFSCQISGRMDIIYTAYEVPTICFCRREQKERAYQKLGIPFRAAPPRRPAPSEPIISHPVAPSLRERDPQGDILHNFSEREWFGPGGLQAGFDGMEEAQLLEAFPVDGMQGLMPGGMVAMDVEDYIVESYQALAMQRRLTRQDVTALLELAGFPQMGEPEHGRAAVSQEQFDDFKRGWQSILGLLQRINVCWNMDDPTIVCGFEIDHHHAVGALRNQPPGTFLCRFSLSQPGNLVLVCKVHSSSVNADGSGLVHGLLNVSDLRERRAEQWIMDFPGATHLLDIYANRRIDKRTTFPAMYSPLPLLQDTYQEMPDQPDESSTYD